MSQRLQIWIAIVTVLIAAGAMILPGRVLSGQYSSRGLKVFHKSFQLTQRDLTAGGTLDRRLRAFGSSVFSRYSSSSIDDTHLNQFLTTVSQQAIHENWKSLVVDVWVGGETSPAGYFFRYGGTDSKGDPVLGEAFITTDISFVKTNLDKYRDFSRVSVKESK